MSKLSQKIESDCFCQIHRQPGVYIRARKVLGYTCNSCHHLTADTDAQICEACQSADVEEKVTVDRQCICESCEDWKKHYPKTKIKH